MHNSELHSYFLIARFIGPAERFSKLIVTYGRHNPGSFAGHGSPGTGPGSSLDSTAEVQL